MNTLSFKIDEASFEIDSMTGFDLSIPPSFRDKQLSAFGVPPAEAIVVENECFLGNTRRGGSCNVEEYRLIPHCHGTHTECVGHIVDDPVYINKILQNAWIPAVLISVETARSRDIEDQYKPKKNPGDLLITRKQIDKGFHRLNDNRFHEALILRTLPNDPLKKTKNYTEAAYCSNDAMNAIAMNGIKHLLVDLPSVDRMDDEGHLSNHRIFWEMEDGVTRLEGGTPSPKTITELIYVEDQIEDGYYFLNLQIAPFESDVAPSRPIVFPVKHP